MTAHTEASTRPAVELRDVDIVFGDERAAALAMIDQGRSRQEILDATGAVLGAAGVSLTIETGEICVLMGLSGSGKSTVLRAVNGLNQVARGAVLVADGDTTVDVASCSDEVLRRLRAVHGRVCWERVLSGSGLAAVYRCLREMGGAESPAVRAALDAADDPAAVVGRFGATGEDALCAQALDVFLDVYGTEAGNMALRHLARGGVYLAGGIAAKVMPRIARGGLLAAFRAKGRMSPIVAEVRLAVVLDPALGLLGAAARAASV